MSQYLGRLRGAGVADVRRDGRRKFYSLAQAPTPLHRTLLRCVRTYLAKIGELAADRERLDAIEPRVRCA